MIQAVADKREEVAMSFVSFEQSRDLIRQAAEGARTEPRMAYLNTMVDAADKDMVVALAKRYGVSQGFIMRAIFAQWRESQLAQTNGQGRE